MTGPMKVAAVITTAVLFISPALQGEPGKERESPAKLLKELDDILEKEEAGLAPPVAGMTAKLLKYVQSRDRSVREKALTLLGNRVYGRALTGSDNWVGMHGREGTIDRGSFDALKGLVQRIGQLEDRAAEMEKKASKTK
ncbi:MAG: hypothetical protein U0793_33840 [Gemmataceae bacterium]